MSFDPTSEQFLAAVWYVAQDAEKQHRRNADKIRRGRQGKWGYLRKVQQALNLQPQQIPYSIMRQQLIEFAETFGVGGPDRAPSSAERAAQQEFG